MNAVRWYAEIVPSRLALLGVNLCGALLVSGLLVSPWLGELWLIKPLLITAILWEWRQGQLRLRQRCGVLSLTSQEGWLWQGQTRRLYAPLIWLNLAVLIRWSDGQRRQQLWLMRDSMSPAAWRRLRAYWFLGRERQW